MTLVLPALFIFLMGLAVGSFLNVVVYRTHDERSVVRGRSRCMVCTAVLRPVDLIPVASFVLLKGRCRSCGTHISWQYPLVELVTGLLFLIVYLRYTTSWMLPPEVTQATWSVAFARDLVFVTYLIIFFVYDLRYSMILDRFSIPAMFVALVFNLWIGIPFVSLVTGAGVLALFFLFQYAISKGTWIGGGDIRMGALMGFMLGLQNALIALFLAYAIGAIVGVILLMNKRAGWRSAVPFGTFLAIGTVIAMFFGEQLADWYLGFLTL